MTPNPLQIVTEWMPNGQVMEYLQNDQSTDRISLVNSLVLWRLGNEYQPPFAM